MRRLIRSLPRRAGRDGHRDLRQGAAGDDAGAGRVRATLPGIIVPGGVTLPAVGAEDAGKVQTIGARFAHGLITLDDAADMGCRACGTPGGGCQFLGTAATSQVVAEAFGHGAAAQRARAVGRAGLAGHGAPLGAGAAAPARRRRSPLSAILTPAALENAMLVHAAFGGSTNLLLHIPAIAHAAGLRAADASTTGTASTGTTPRLVDALPNGPRNHPTVQVFMAGGVPEVMLHLRAHGPAQRRRADRDRRDARHGARLVGGERPPARGARAPAGSRTASIPTT